ncbi:hypothetical protein [Marinicella sp. W31]|uniref:hypothetical protein n=1 Tax=Marinicella sp. W31 TaxID=3023713 RepID=UPI0037581B20
MKEYKRTKVKNTSDLMICHKNVYEYDSETSSKRITDSVFELISISELLVIKTYESIFDALMEMHTRQRSINKSALNRARAF